MIRFKIGRPSKKEEKQIVGIIQEYTDIYGDFYITKNNLRYYIKENKDLLYDCLDQGDRIVYDEEKGLILITGFGDQSPRKYIKILAKDDNCASDLIKVLFWHLDCDVYAKVKKNSPIRRILQGNQFRFAGDRGKEILLRKEYVYQEKGEK